MMIGALLVIAGLIYAVLGLLHAIFTLLDEKNPRRLAPDDPAVVTAMQNSKLRLSRGATTPQPTVVYFHGGFWAAGSKEGSLMSLIPWMEMGCNVVNVEYRLARVAPAPAAVEDGLCALRFLAAQAKARA